MWTEFVWKVEKYKITVAQQVEPVGLWVWSLTPHVNVPLSNMLNLFLLVIPVPCMVLNGVSVLYEFGSFSMLT